MIIRAGIILTILLSLTSCDRHNSDIEEVPETPEAIVCDTLLPFTIELLKNDEYVIEYEGMEMTQRRYFTINKYNSETKERSTLQIPFADSTFKKLSGSTKFDGVDLDTIFKNNELQSYSQIAVTNECINWKVITADTMTFWNTQYQKELKKDINFNMPREWFRYYAISTPVMSISKDYIYVEIDEECWGMCSQGFSYLFRKVDGSWSCVGRWTRWVS
tara:strand:- start:7034 stop:7687 length:654 start_codon:yes stop_codon:yes gene_type:complete